MVGWYHQFSGHELGQIPGVHPPKLMCIESVMPSSHLILCRPLLLLLPIPPSMRIFSNESTLCIRWPKHWSFSFSISPSNQHPGLISFRMDWLDVLAVQGTLKSLLQHHSSKPSIIWCSAFFTVQLYIHTWLLDWLIPKRMKFCHLQNWMELENIMLSEINWTKINTIWNHLYIESKR